MIYIKNIIFDMGKVILKGRAYSMLDNFNLDINTYNRLKEFFNDWYNLDIDNETIEEKFDSYNYSDEIKEKYKTILLEYYKYRELNMGLIDLIKRLKENNYNVYILSDNNKYAANYYINHELFLNIDGFMFSYEYKTIKKEGKLFDIFLNKFNLDPKECYFIDNEKINIIEAEKHGIKGYLFNETDDINLLYEDMKNNNILIN